MLPGPSCIHSILIEYCNSLMAGLPRYQLAKLQTVQNVAARVISNIIKRDHIAPALIHLLWLPVRF